MGRPLPADPVSSNQLGTEVAWQQALSVGLLAIRLIRR